MPGYWHFYMYVVRKKWLLFVVLTWLRILPVRVSKCSINSSKFGCKLSRVGTWKTSDASKEKVIKLNLTLKLPWATKTEFLLTLSSRQVRRIKKNINKRIMLIQYQILQTNITRIVWHTVRRITNEILGIKAFTDCKYHTFINC